MRFTRQTPPSAAHFISLAQRSHSGGPRTSSILYIRTPVVVERHNWHTLVFKFMQGHLRQVGEYTFRYVIVDHPLTRPHSCHRTLLPLLTPDSN